LKINQGYTTMHVQPIIKTACEVSQTLSSAPCSQKPPMCHIYDNCIISSSVTRVASIKIWDRQTRNDTGRLKDTGQETMGVGFISHPNNCSLVGWGRGRI